MKKSLLFISFLFLGSVTAMGASYSDVKEGDRYYAAVEYLTELGVVEGYGDGTFKPNVLVNRAEAVKMAVNAFAIEADGEYQGRFGDVNAGSWFFPFVMEAAKRGVVEGYGDGTFKPGNTVNYGEAMKIVLLSGGFSVPESVNGDVYRDVKSSDWFAAFFAFARDNNVVQSNLEGNISPGKFMSRGEIAEIVYRLMEVKKNGHSFRVENTWGSFTKPELGVSMKLDHDVWRVNHGEDEVIFWRADGVGNQFSPGLIYDNSGRVWVTRDKNTAKKTKSDYFMELKAVFSGGAAKEFVIGGLEALELVFADERRVDWYIAMEDGTFMVIYTEYGRGVLGGEIKKNIEAMLRSLVIGEAGGTDGNGGNEDGISEVLSQVFANILVEGKGMESLNLFEDKVIIETDVIGVGTGPVDYYFSPSAGYTFKYERAADVILDKREGSTSQF